MQRRSDDAPGYLKLPRAVRDNWPKYASSVRALCIAAIKKRKTHRLYLKWLEAEIKQLGRRALSDDSGRKQLSLPWDG